MSLKKTKKLSPEVVEEMFQTGNAVGVTDSFSSEYFLVYGTLRLMGGNWRWHLKNKSEYITTLRVPGIVHHGGISASWVGKEFDIEKHNTKWCTLDLFKVDPNCIQEVNRSIDMLEGTPDWYLSTAVPLVINGENIIAKFYHMPHTRFSDVGDYYQEHRTPKLIIEHAKVFNAEEHEVKNIGKFISFYENESAENE